MPPLLWGIARRWSPENSSSGIRWDFDNKMIISFQLYTIRNNYTFHDPQLRLHPKVSIHGINSSFTRQDCHLGSNPILAKLYHSFNNFKSVLN